MIALPPKKRESFNPFKYPRLSSLDVTVLERTLPSIAPTSETIEPFSWALLGGEDTGSAYHLAKGIVASNRRERLFLFGQYQHTLVESPSWLPMAEFTALRAYEPSPNDAPTRLPFGHAPIGLLVIDTPNVDLYEAYSRFSNNPSPVGNKFLAPNHIVAINSGQARCDDKRAIDAVKELASRVAAKNYATGDQFHYFRVD